MVRVVRTPCGFTDIVGTSYGGEVAGEIYRFDAQPEKKLDYSKPALQALVKKEKRKTKRKNRRNSVTHSPQEDAPQFEPIDL